MVAKRVNVIVDDRERSGGVVQALRARTDLRFEVRRLDAGDYLVEDRVIVERKTLADFAISLIDGRLFSQATDLITQPVRAVIILEGTTADLQATGVRREALQGALITLGAFFGLPVLRSLDPEETVRLLMYLGRQSQRIASGGLPRPGCRPKGKHARQLFLLQGLPGVGPERAARLLERFGTVAGVVAASSDELANVDGLGDKTATKIRWALEEPAAGFGPASG